MFFSLAAALGALHELAPHELAAMQALMPGPVTLLVSNQERRYGAACGPDPDTLGLRVPALALGAAALQGVGSRFCRRAPTIPAATDAATTRRRPGSHPRRCRPRARRRAARRASPSTVIDLRGGPRRWEILRLGALPAEAVERALGARAIGGR